MQLNRVTGVVLCRNNLNLIIQIVADMKNRLVLEISCN